MGRPRKQKQDPESGYYVVKEGTVISVDGASESIAANEPIPAGHPWIKGREDLFRPWTTKYPLPDKESKDDDEESDADEDIEQATAAPGEKRNR